MQIYSIKNYGITSKNNKLNSTPTQAPAPKAPQVAFKGLEEHENNGSNSMRNLIYGLMLLGATAATTPALTSCDDGSAYAYAHVDINMSGLDSLIDSCHCHPDTIREWYYGFNRPQPLDSLFNNLKNWDIDGTDGNKYDPKAKRNITHYEGTREWEYNTKEIGDIRLTESSRNILVYDVEIKDYKGNHESYGKRVLRIPTSPFEVTKADGTTLHSPKGFFVEEYDNPTNDKSASILDCKLKTRAFVQTNGDTLNVAKLEDSNEYVEKGKVAKGYLGANSILLKNLIGQYPTDDHYADFKTVAVDDETLRRQYVKDMDFEVSEGKR